MRQLSGQAAISPNEQIHRMSRCRFGTILSQRYRIVDSEPLQPIGARALQPSTSGKRAMENSEETVHREHFRRMASQLRAVVKSTPAGERARLLRFVDQYDERATALDVQQPPE